MEKEGRIKNKTKKITKIYILSSCNEINDFFKQPSFFASDKPFERMT
jgi:hypothetical protein